MKPLCSFSILNYCDIRDTAKMLDRRRCVYRVVKLRQNIA